MKKKHNLKIKDKKSFETKMPVDHSKKYWFLLKVIVPVVLALIAVIPSIFK